MNLNKRTTLSLTLNGSINQSIVKFNFQLVQLLSCSSNVRVQQKGFRILFINNFPSSFQNCLGFFISQITSLHNLGQQPLTNSRQTSMCSCQSSQQSSIWNSLLVYNLCNIATIIQQTANIGFTPTGCSHAISIRICNSKNVCFKKVKRLTSFTAENFINLINDRREIIVKDNIFTHELRITNASIRHNRRSPNGTMHSSTSVLS